MSENTSARQLVEELALALLSHHTGLVTTEPFARTYERDQALLNKAENFLVAATQGRPQPVSRKVSKLD